MENALLEEGTAFSIQDEAGNVLYEGAGVKQANSIIFACGQLAEGQTYSLVVNGQAVATAQAAPQQGTGGRMDEPGGPGQAYDGRSVCCGALPGQGSFTCSGSVCGGSGDLWPRACKRKNRP